MCVFFDAAEATTACASNERREIIIARYYTTLLIRQCERDDGIRRGDRQILLAAESVRHRSGADSASGLKFPKRLASPRIDGDQVPLSIPCKHEPARGGQHSTARRRNERKAPFGRACRWVDCHHRTVSRVLGDIVDRAQLIPLSFNVSLLVLVVNVASVGGPELIEPGLRTIRSGLPVVASSEPRTRLRPLVARILTGKQDRPPITSDALRPSDFRVRF